MPILCGEDAHQEQRWAPRLLIIMHAKAVTDLAGLPPTTTDRAPVRVARQVRSMVMSSAACCPRRDEREHRRRRFQVVTGDRERPVRARSASVPEKSEAHQRHLSSPEMAATAATLAPDKQRRTGAAVRAFVGHVRE